jgi:hypothetical protein
MREQALGVLAQVISRDGQELSATQVRQRGLANADHLAILHAIWASEITPAREQRYRDLLSSALPPGYQAGNSHRARWLWRTLRSAELAGLDPAKVLRDAVAQRSLADARDIAAVLDSRIRRTIRGLVPQPRQPWTGHVPALADQARQGYAAQVARLMDERTGRIGEHAAEHELPWAARALGPVPSDPPGRLDWQRRASAIGAYRELYGWDDPADPIGPEPAGGDPDRRAAWHHALAALGPPGDGDVRGLPDGMLHHLRDTYPIDTAWAPRWVGDELRQARLGAWQARLAAIRASAEAAAARRADTGAVAAGQEGLAAATGDGQRVRRAGELARLRDGRPPRMDQATAAGAAWLWRPTPNRAAATPASIGRCARPDFVGHRGRARQPPPGARRATSRPASGSGSEKGLQVRHPARQPHQARAQADLTGTTSARAFDTGHGLVRTHRAATTPPQIRPSARVLEQPPARRHPEAAG